MFYRVLRGLNRRAHFKKNVLRDKVHSIIDRAYFKESEGLSSDKRKIYFHCVAWGPHLDWFFSYTVPSLLQDGNIPQLARDGYELKLIIYAHPEEYQAVANQYIPRLTLLNKYLSVITIPLTELKGGWLQGYYVPSALIDQIKRCIDEEAIVVFTGGDLIYGNRSLTNAVRMVQGKNVFLALAIPRVSQESILTSDVFAGLKNMERSIENDELVDLAFEHGHDFLLGFFDDEDTNRTHGGISIRKINDGTYSVIYNNVAPIIGHFTNDDLKYCARSGSSMDTRWPRLLFRQNRLKVVGSSDCVFLAEVTANDGRHIPAMKSGLLNNDKEGTTRAGRLLHNFVGNSFCATWIGRKSRRRY